MQYVFIAGPGDRQLGKYTANQKAHYDFELDQLIDELKEIDPDFKVIIAGSHKYDPIINKLDSDQLLFIDKPQSKLSYDQQIILAVQSCTTLVVAYPMDKGKQGIAIREIMNRPHQLTASHIIIIDDTNPGN